MNKQELVDFVAKKTDLTKKDAHSAVDAMFEGIISCLKNGIDARFVGFGSFFVNARAARTGRNPRTGEEIKIAASKQPSFRPGKEFKAAVNS